MDSKILLDKSYSIGIYRCRDRKQILNSINKEFEKHKEIFPNFKNALILLKPNLNSNMNSLTGNTTDLRVISSVIEILKDYGYRKIIIGEGTSSGFYRNRINIFSRLKIDKLAQYYGVQIMDFNYASYKEIFFEDGIKAYVAKICTEVDFFINIPKIKMHFETMMSVALKSLIGCLVGLENKQKVHFNLFKNIINLNKYIKPDLHVIDGLICMEGTGPSRGIPIRMDTILVGRNPYVIDLVCARVANVNFWEIPVLKLAYHHSLFSYQHICYVNNLDLSNYKKIFKRPKVNFLAKFVNDQRWQKYFIKLRLTPFFNFLCNLNLVGKILNYTGLRQDIFVMEDDAIQDLEVTSRCDKCRICNRYCPISLNLPEEIGDKSKECIFCLYCYFICPKNAINIKGKLGFLTEQLKYYDFLIRNLENEED